MKKLKMMCSIETFLMSFCLALLIFPAWVAGQLEIRPAVPVRIDRGEGILKVQKRGQKARRQQGRAGSRRQRDRGLDGLIRRLDQANRQFGGQGKQGQKRQGKQTSPPRSKSRRVPGTQSQQSPISTQPKKDYIQWMEELQEKRNEAFRKEHPPRESTGLVALTDLGKDLYEGQEGGLYPGGGNIPPASHLNNGLKLANEIVPLNRIGNPSANGKIVLLSVGVSSTTQEFHIFKQIAETDPEINPHLVLVNGAQGGQSARVLADPEAYFWQATGEHLSEVDVTPHQVQVAWIKQMIWEPTQLFPGEVKVLQQHLSTTLDILVNRFPNLKIAYLSSQSYAGYAKIPLTPEPHAYESGFAVKWLIADQIDAKPQLNYDSTEGTVRSPWIAWGPYLWTDGIKGRSDGLVYTEEDLELDGTHPSTSGRKKVAELLLEFFKQDPTAQGWFLKKQKISQNRGHD